MKSRYKPYGAFFKLLIIFKLSSHATWTAFGGGAKVKYTQIFVRLM